MPAGFTVADKLARLDDPHVVALEALRDAIAGFRSAPVPHFDPHDGGTLAEVLLLLETPGPGPGQGSGQGSGHRAGQGPGPERFVSRDNPTGTARNITRFCAAAGLQRGRMVIWNTVPWIIHRPGERNRPPRRREIEQGLAALPACLELLPALKVVVLAGRVAAQAEAVVARAGLAVLTMPHPSPIYVNTAPTIAPAMTETLRAAAAMLPARI